ncbi:putative nuclease with TOPRIM domain [Oikeobacillus pervagus]|uniref:Nuclease with TOPRIM domain n=1 Tax=Oikeobacillus pervagus TaxID=1325931 RepID=A0AAJ1SYN1_9BACI|nr:putative nuclease with TOPRIM domain [Oikeobacillus pervagus]
MSSMRQDAWTKEEDLLLAEIVLQHIREGSTQLQAFDEVGKRLNRTAAACGFRWNSFVRKQYKSGIELAKKQRKEMKIQETMDAGHSMKEDSSFNEKTSPTLSVDDVITFIHNIAQQAQLVERVSQETDILQDEISKLQNQLNQTQSDYDQLKIKYKELEDDYHSVLLVLEKARKLTVENK